MLWVARGCLQHGSPPLLTPGLVAPARCDPWGRRGHGRVLRAAPRAESGLRWEGSGVPRWGRPCRAGACDEVVQNEFCPATKAAVLRCVSIPTRLCRGAFV